MRPIWVAYWTLLSAFALLELLLGFASYGEAGSAMPICGILFGGIGIAGAIVFLLAALLILIFVPNEDTRRVKANAAIGAQFSESDIKKSLDASAQLRAGKDTDESKD